MTTVQILDSNLNVLAEIKSFIPLSGGTILTYSKELSDYGTARFRLSSYDPMFTNIGDIVVPHTNHIRIVRNGTAVWQGAIIENPKRTKDFVEIQAVTYLWYLGKKLILRSSNNPATGVADAVYRIFNSGTMAQAVTAVMNETIAKYAGTNHALALLTLGEVDNPPFPPNITDAYGSALTGPWTFGTGIAPTTQPTLTFDFHSVLYVMKSFGAYTYADFEIDDSMVFNFKSFLGNNKQYNVNFVYGPEGNAVDFNITRLGQRQVNDLWGIAVDTNGQILHQEQTDQPSIDVNGFLEEVVPYADIKDQGTLNARVAAELPLISTADSSANTMVLSEKAYPLGVWDVGDIVTTKVDHIAVQHQEVSRIVGYTVSLDSTGRELITVQTNKPLPWEYGAS